MLILNQIAFEFVVEGSRKGIFICKQKRILLLPQYFGAAGVCGLFN